MYDEFRDEADTMALHSVDLGVIEGGKKGNGRSKGARVTIAAWHGVWRKIAGRQARFLCKLSDWSMEEIGEDTTSISITF